MTKQRKEQLKEYLPTFLQERIGINIRRPFHCFNPNHPDANPSMSFNRNNNTIKCFSCGETYDIKATDKTNTDKAVLELKRLSRDYKIPVIGISSFNRDSYSNKVSMKSFKESGAIEYGSDVLIGLQLKGADDKNFDVDKEKQKDPREVELVILKNRNGATGKKVNYKYYPMFNFFEEVHDGDYR